MKLNQWTKTIVATAAALIFSVSIAEAKKKKEKKEDKTAVETLKVDVAASSVEWIGSKKAGSKHHGQIKLKDGSVEMKSGKLTAGSFTVDMATITNEDLKDSPDYQTKLVGHLKSDDFFKVEKNPTSKFVSTSVTEKDGKTLVKGKLTILETTNEIEFPVTLETKDGVTTGTAKLEIDRTKWGIKYGSGSFFKELVADKIINDTFELNLKLVAKK